MFYWARWVSRHIASQFRTSLRGVDAVAGAGVVYLRSGSTLRTGTSVTPTPPAGPNPVTYSFVTPTLGWAVLNVTNPPSPPAQFEVFSTTDGAQHWRLQFTGHGSTPGFAQLTVHLFDSSNGFMALGLPSTGQELYKTVDRGATGTPAQLPSPPCVEVPLLMHDRDGVCCKT